MRGGYSTVASLVHARYMVVAWYRMIVTRWSHVLTGHSTGKQIGGLVECSPFKLTAEYVELLDGEGSPVYNKFCDACVAAMVACRSHGETICTMIEIVGTRSVFPCFGVFSLAHVISTLRKRLFMHLEVRHVTLRYVTVMHLEVRHVTHQIGPTRPATPPDRPHQIDRCGALSSQVNQVEAAFRKTIKLTTSHWGSRKYDYFQNKQRGIAI